MSLTWNRLAALSALLVAFAGGCSESGGGAAVEDDDADPSTADEGEDDGDDGEDRDEGEDDGPRGNLDASVRRDASSDDDQAKDAGSAERDGSTKAPDSGLVGRMDASAPPAGDASVPPPASGGSGSAVSKTVTVGGASRTYRLYIPKGLDSTQPVPFVSVHHGFTMSGEVMENLTTWKGIADREKFVVVFPNGGGASPWNVGAGVCNVGAFVGAPSTQDDFGFVKAMIAQTKEQQAIDDDQVFVGGFSMGGYFANHVGCQGRDFVKAVSSHSGGTYDGTCPGQPVPVLIIHGEADTLIPYACGSEARDRWATRNGCQAETESEQVRMGTCEWNKGCPAGQEVGMCTLKAMDHGWAGAKFTGPWITLQYGGGDQFEDAAEMMWKFFKSYL